MEKVIRFNAYMLTACLLFGFGSTFWSRHAHASDYTFYYKLKPGQTWLSKKTSILQFRSPRGNVRQVAKRMVRYKISESAAQDSISITAKVVEQTNDGRRIRTFEGVSFKGVLKKDGTLSYYSFSGGSGRYRPIIDAACPAMEYEIFWMPRFPGHPLKVGDHFTDSLRVRMGNESGSILSAQVRWVYSLTAIRGHMAYFSAEDRSFMKSPGVSGSSAGQELCLFDMQEGMWSEFNIRTKGKAYGPGMRGGKDYRETIKIKIQRQ